MVCVLGWSDSGLHPYLGIKRCEWRAEVVTVVTEGAVSVDSLSAEPAAWVLA